MANIKIFEERRVRSVWNEAEQQWYFSVQDVVEVLTGSANVKDYLNRMRKRDSQLDNNRGTIWPLVAGARSFVVFEIFQGIFFAEPPELPFQRFGEA